MFKCLIENVTFIILLSWSSEAHFGGHNIHKSVSEVKTLLQSEQRFFNQAVEALDVFSTLTKVFEDYIESYKEMGIQTWNEKKMEDPVKAYLLIRHTALGWESVHLKLVENIEKINKVIRGVELREMEKLPDMRDLEGAALGLGRLVSYYGQGQDNQDSSFVTKLKELNSFDLAIAAAQSANQEELYDAAYDYMTLLEQRIKMADQQDKQLLQSLGFSISDIPGYKKSIGTAHDNKLRKGGVRSGLKHQQILSKTTINQPVQEITDLPSYQTVERRGANLLTQIAERQMVELCRMKRRRISSTNLKCSFISTESIQTLLAPFKAEEVHMNPDIVIIKQIFSEVECEETKENLKTRIQDQQGSERKGKDWSMKNVWMNESDSKGLQVLSRRLEAATGFSTDNKEEPFMIGNYGIGGSYGVHPDYHHPESSTDNRIMTTMTVVSSPVQGGTTVWPFLGVSVILQKGDTLIWKNLSNEGDPLVLTHHAACPVLQGDKWIVNKWLSYNEQWNRNKCMRTAVNKSMK